MRRLRGLSEEAMLRRVPRGYTEDHPAARWLRFQSFTVGRQLTDAQATSSRLTATLQADFAAILPLVRWLNSVMGLEPKQRR